MIEAVASGMISQALGIVSQGVGVSDRIKASLRRTTISKKLEVYTISSLQATAQNYPDIISIFFDEAFLKTRGAEAVAQMLSRAKRPDPDELTSLWLDQFAFPAIINERTRMRVRSASKDFLVRLNNYLLGDPEFRDFFDSLSLDRIAIDIGSIKEKMYENKPKPKLRIAIFRQEKSFLLHDLPAVGKDSPAANVTLSVAKNLTDTEVFHDIHAPINIERWKTNQRMKLFWQIVIDNIGDDLDTDIILSCRLRQGYIIETRIVPNIDVKSTRQGEPSLGTMRSFKFEKILPGERVGVVMITDNDEIPEVDAWSKGMGKIGLSMVCNIHYEILQPSA